MALYYNGIMVSGINFTPRLTLAEYNALEVKPDYWIRTDAESNNITASDIDCTSSGGTTTDVQTELNNKVDKETGKGLFSGSYNDLTDKPSLATVATSGSYNDLSNKPSLSTVATSGSYTDLTDKPTIPAAQVNSDWNSSSGVSEILNKPAVNNVYQENSIGNAPYRVLLSHAYDDTSENSTTKKCSKLYFNPSKGELDLVNNTGTAETDAVSTFVLGNNIAAGTAGSSYGRVYIYSDGTKAVDLRAATNSSGNRVIYLPNKAGTIALTSDIPTISNTKIYIVDSVDIAAGATKQINKTTTLNKGKYIILPSGGLIYDKLYSIYITFKLLVGGTEVHGSRTGMGIFGYFEVSSDSTSIVINCVNGGSSSINVSRSDNNIYYWNAVKIG